MGKRGQIWIETVLYFLIGIAIIGTLLYIVVPKITQMNDKAVITQTIDSLNEIDNQISNIAAAAGNSREVVLMVKKGEYVIDCIQSSIYYKLSGTKLLYSQVNETVRNGDIYIFTEAAGKDTYNIYLMLNYPSYNLTYSEKKSNKQLFQAPTAYRLLIENLGKNENIVRVNLRLL